jgi:hypothetical protein
VPSVGRADRALGVHLDADEAAHGGSAGPGRGGMPQGQGDLVTIRNRRARRVLSETRCRRTDPDSQRTAYRPVLIKIMRVGYLLNLRTDT